eukprot:GHUV01032097.1.p1 GENE.GHUV01032097.1~~GHUV01032097.1.p1  ORF type:complete len:235 (-),score=87.50 GHUV01032097.1:501-1205(-)
MLRMLLNVGLRAFLSARLFVTPFLQAAAAVQITKKEEQELLERIRQEFGAKHVVRVCSMFECDRVLDGARRLLEFAPTIKQTVDLRGASLAIDDCYEVWGSGFISIPYDFTLQELQPQLRKLLSAGKAASNGSSNGNGASSSSNGSVPHEQMRPVAAVGAAAGLRSSSLGLCSGYTLHPQPHAGWTLRRQHLQQRVCGRLCSSYHSSRAVQAVPAVQRLRSAAAVSVGSCRRFV